MFKLLLPEWIKFRSNPTALALTAASFSLPFLIYAFNHFGPKGTSMEATTTPWLLTPLTLVAFLAPFLLTLDDNLGTSKWLSTTPTRMMRLVLGKVMLIVGLCLLSLPLSAALGHMATANAAQLLQGGAAILISTLVMVALSLLTRSFAISLIVSVIWMQLASHLLSLVPASLREAVWSALPGLGLSQTMADHGNSVARLVSVLALIALSIFMMNRRNPQW